MARYHKRANFLGLELLNEPTSWGVPLPVLQDYYTDGYRIVRKYSDSVYVILGARVGGAIGEWNDFMTDQASYYNVILDVHMYQVHDRMRFGAMSAEDHVRFAKFKRLDEVRRLGDHPNMLVMVGEWSASLPKAAEAAEEDYVAFAKAQLASFGEATAGWCYWSYKIERQGYRHWSLRKSIEAGYLPASIAPAVAAPAPRASLPTSAPQSARQSKHEDEDGDGFGDEIAF